jgi:hypothetical protein
VKRAFALALLVAGCGAAPPSAERPPGDAERWTREAAEAWASLDPERAARLADRALQLGASDDAREIAARSLLALGRPERAARALEGTSDPVLLRLRARAQMALDRYADAVDSFEAARRHQARSEPDDAWTEAALAAARAARDAERPYAVEGAERAELELVEAPLPLVRVRVDTREVLALIGTGADFVLVDPAVRDASGTLGELGLGALRVRDVPFLTRSLEPVREGLGQDVRVVIGADLLMRLGATLDGPARRLHVHREPPVRGEDASAALLTPGAAFLVVEARVDDRRGWLTVDTAGLVPVALGPDGAEALGLAELEWSGSEPGPRLAVVPALQLGSMVIEELPVVQGLLDESHARAAGAPVIGSVGWTLLGQLRLGFDPHGRRIVFESGNNP